MIFDRDYEMLKYNGTILPSELVSNLSVITNNNNIPIETCVCGFHTSTLFIVHSPVAFHNNFRFIKTREEDFHLIRKRGIMRTTLNQRWICDHHLHHKR